MTWYDFEMTWNGLEWHEVTLNDMKWLRMILKWHGMIWNVLEWHDMNLKWHEMA